jgi:flavin-dependent dehydrogenase
LVDAAEPLLLALAVRRDAGHRGGRLVGLDGGHRGGRLVTRRRAARADDGRRLYGPSLAAIDLESPGYYFLATDTSRLMTWLAREAGKAGAQLRYGTPFRGACRRDDRIELPDCGVWARFLVGADGPRSAVARHLGLGRNRAFLLGVEAEIMGLRGLDPDRLHCFLDAQLMPGYIGWAFIGVGGVAQVGLACRQPVRPDLDAFMAKQARVFDFGNARVIGRRGGLIPVGGRVAPFGGERVLLVGDAAGIVSPLTAGGIHTALESGWRAGHAIADHLFDGAEAPHHALATAYPRFFWKRRLRQVFDVGPPNWLIDAGLATPPLRALAQSIYFHRRGLLSRRVWSDLLRTDERRRAG